MAIGLDRPARELGIDHYSTVLLPDWLERLGDYSEFGGLPAGAPGARMPGLIVVSYDAIDSGLNQVGTHSISIAGIDRLTNWDGLGADDYAAKREAWTTAIITQLDRFFPGFESAVVQREMATAATMARYLNTPGGAVYGFAQTPPHGVPTAGTPRGVHTTVPGLYLASTYGGFGGFSGAMFSGLLAAREAVRSQAPEHARL